MLSSLGFESRPVAHGPRRPASHGPRRPGGPVLIFCSFFVQRLIHAHAQICTRFGREKWTTVSSNSFTILIILSILFDPFFPCMLLSEKRCHSLFIRLFTEPDREEVHSQTMKVIFKPQFEIENFHFQRMV